MRRQSPLMTGFIYIILGILFTVFAVQNVSADGWNFFSFLLIFLATIDFGSGFRMIMLHLKIKSIQKKK
ncbi:YdiK family protein [Peribacillus alkalitolerans]|uniref:YdiK family protein n=1 Tax=Peribacillus alkalitolerans TaxID=1550385 RepID=UPI0013D40093|nr:YdiK family protein [Peribacillus alkalitolerans]